MPNQGGVTWGLDWAALTGATASPEWGDVLANEMDVDCDSSIQGATKYVRFQR